MKVVQIKAGGTKLELVIKTASRVLPYSILVRLAYTVVKRLLKEIFPYKYADSFAKLIILKIVREDYKMYFIICFALEYFFKRYVYTAPKEQKEYWKAGLTCLSMGLFSTAMVLGKPRAIRPLNAISGYNINHMSEWWRGIRPHFRPAGANPLVWHGMLYFKSAKKALVPLTLAVAVPTFLFGLRAKQSMESYLTRSWARLPQTTSDIRDYDYISTIVKRTLKKTARYGLYVTIGLSNYVQLVDGWNHVLGHPSLGAVFFFGLYGAWPYFFIPEDKVFAYDHWALTTMLDAHYQGSSLQSLLKIG